MERYKKGICLTAVIAGLFFFCGCGEQAQIQKKQQMVQAWEKSTAQAKLPGVRDLIDRGQIEEAKKVLTECMQADPENPEVLFLVALVHLAEGRSESAERSLQKSLEIDAQREEAWFALGLVHQENNQYEQAQACYLRALELQPIKIDFILALVHLYTIQGQVEQARDLLEEKRRQIPDNFKLIMASADLAQRYGNPQEAIDLYKEAVLKQGDNPRLLEALGLCYMSQRQWEPAADVFKRLLYVQKNKQLPEHVLGWLSFCSLQAGRYGEALAYYDQLSILRREDPQVWLEMGQAALGAESPDRAVYCGEKALHLQSSWTDAEVVIGCGLYMKKNYTEAVRIFQKICRDPKWEPFGWWMAGRCYQQLGQNAQARSAFEKASQLQPDSDMVRMFLNESAPGVSNKSGKTL